MLDMTNLNLKEVSTFKGNGNTRKNKTTPYITKSVKENPYGR